MSAAERLGDDPVDDSERLEVRGGDLHRFRGFGSLVGGAPQDRRAAFGRDHRIDRMLEHQHPVGRSDRDRAARSALADDHRDHRHFQRQALLGRAGDGFGLAALLGLHARKCARSIDQGHDRKAEPVGQRHQPDRLAIAVGLGHAEIVPEARGGVVALLLADQHDLAAVDPGEAADDRGVVGKGAVAGERQEILGEARHIIVEMRTVGMPGDLGLLPCRELGVGIAEQLVGLGLEPRDLRIDVDLI